MNKRTLILAALFIFMGFVAWYAISSNKKTGTLKGSDMDFGVTEPDRIGKIFIAERNGATALLERKDGYWLYNGKYKARPTAIKTLLETIKTMVVRTVPPDAAKDAAIKELAASGIKVEIYDRDDDIIKVYFIGGVTSDERGTYVMMAGSKQPYVAQLQGFVGQLRVRFFTGDDNWRDRYVFEENPEEIKSVSVEYPQQKSQSFRIDKTPENTFEVKPFYSTTPTIKKPQRKGVPEGYLLQFEKIGAESFESDSPVRDSVSNLVPFVIINLENTAGKTKKVRFWPLEIESNPNTGETYVVRYFTDINDGEAFLLTQHLLFGKLFRGYDFFFEK